MAPRKRVKRAVGDDDGGAPLAGEDAVARAIFQHYAQQQVGGTAYPVFRGQPIQSGEGIGDILRSIGRFLLPILSPAAKTAAKSFVTGTAKNIMTGKSLGEALKTGAKTAAGEGIEALGKRVSERIQTGKGRRRRSHRTSARIAALRQQYGRGRKRRTAKAYKKAPKHRRRKSKRFSIPPQGDEGTYNF